MILGHGESQNTVNSLAEDAYKRLEEMIVTTELKPNTIVSEKEISEYLGIGRTPVREALKKLEQTKAITFLPRKGILVRIVSVAELLQQMEVREVLEDLAVNSASLYATPAERSRLVSLAARYRELTEAWEPAIEALRIDDAFNRLLCQCSKNGYIADALLPLHTLARRNYYLNYFVDKELTRDVNLLHAELMDTISGGDAAAAVECNHRLLETVKKFSSLSLRVWLPGVENI